MVLNSSVATTELHIAFKELMENCFKHKILCLATLSIKCQAK